MPVTSCRADRRAVTSPQGFTLSSPCVLARAAGKLELERTPVSLWVTPTLRPVHAAFDG
jgi:hypothetical protein